MGWFSGKDNRSAEDRAAWESHAFTEEDAAAAGSTVEKMEKERAEDARRSGDPTAPPK